jgi:hypothetical protein
MDERYNETISLSRELAIRKSDGVPYEVLSEEEQEILDNDASLLDSRIETILYQRPAQLSNS